jgi:hypothetical protein
MGIKQVRILKIGTGLIYSLPILDRYIGFTADMFIVQNQVASGTNVQNMEIRF